MSEASKKAILEAMQGNSFTAVAHAQAIVLAYASSAGAQQAYIPRLFHDLMELFTSGEVKATGATSVSMQR